MIERHWKGICRPKDAPGYQRHLMEDTFRQLALISGYKGGRILKRDTADGLEFLVITIWGSLDDIRKFSGDDLTAAVVPKQVSDIMLSYDRRAVHYELEKSFG